MNCLWVVVLAVVFSGVLAVPTPSPTPPTSEASSSYVPHATYPYADSYGPIAPYQAGYLYPRPEPSGSYITAVIPAVQIALRLFAKVGLFVMGGMALLVIGGLFTTAVCSLTPICTITFAGYGALDKDTVRSLMTPEKISTAAALVQDAIGKYQRMQRAIK